MAQEAPVRSPANILSAPDALVSALVPASTAARTSPEPISPADNNLSDGPSPQTGQQQSEPDKGSRRRNKPSLSCQACTSKKTKCDRTRPICLACLKRRSECQYSELADLIEYGDIQPSGFYSVNQFELTQPSRESHRALGIESPRKKPRTSAAGASHPAIIQAQNAGRPIKRMPSRSSTGSSPKLLSNVPFSNPTMSNLFKAEHPFSNYWTHQGGLAEVIGVLPSREQADILVAKFFDAVDPVYPMINRDSFQHDYCQFWDTGPLERTTTDASLVALIFVMLAMGTQFVDLPSPEEKKQTAEFYISASHQALRMFSYLGRPSMRSIQTMVLITYFLMNDNHASDAWAFAGILQRQAYAIGLNRDPSIVKPDAQPSEMQQRRKVWQAVFMQDTFLSVIIKLPPTLTHTDVRIEDLTEDEGAPSEHGATDTSFIRSMVRKLPGHSNA
ncbi:MAG: hypothetical protein LQ343_005898 [Gyalolechia ehrenbergii]|nr:MAG: hypothetical protein LQ343_005898 [Gyalolechia ehrenbergii]